MFTNNTPCLSFGWYRPCMVPFPVKTPPGAGRPDCPTSSPPGAPDPNP